MLNDIGPEISAVGLARIEGYVGRAQPITNWTETIAQLKSTYEIVWPGLSNEEWERFVHRSYREDKEGVPLLDEPECLEAIDAMLSRLR